MTELKTIAVAGAGVMGSQVSWQAAWHGKRVFVFDAFEAGLAKGRRFHQDYGREFMAERGASQADVERAQARLSYSTDLATALEDADVLIEQVPEDIKIKQDFWGKASKLAPEKTIFCTNTSSLLPSTMVPFVDRPEKFLTLHYCVKVWEANVGEVMVASGTEEKYFDAIVQLAREMGLVPIAIRKEQAGYVLNSVLIPWMIAAIDLVRDGVSNHEDIDRTWMICNKSKIGPLMMCDMVGMNAAYHIAKGLSASANNKQAGLVAEFLKAELVDQGKLGAASGEGFYKYPNPRFEKDDFLEPV